MQIFDKHVMLIQNSLYPANQIHTEFIRQSPRYFAYQSSYSLDDFPDKRIYPS